MSGQVDLKIQELTNLRLALREDLLLSPSVGTGGERYSIEDPITTKFYYVGLREYSFLSLLDGRLTVGEALQLAATREPDFALSEPEAATLCRWLVDTQLVRTMGRFGQISSEATKEPRGEAPGRFNPLVIKRSVVDPDQWLSTLDRHFSWLFGPTAFGVWLVAVLSGIYVVVLHADRLQQASVGVLATDNWLWLGVSWMALKLIHETSHGIVCKRYRGSVREAGLLFILLMPVAYVDMTSAWRFRSKWHRIHAAVAGMYAELFVASLAACVWSQPSTSVMQHIAFNIMLMASVTTLVFNANPLLRFDGYYVLADWLEIPNLASHASQLWRAWARRFFLGLPSPPSNLPPGQRRLVRCYGLAALAWRSVVTVSLILAASVMFHGAGIVLAVAGAIFWCLVPCAKAASSVWKLRGTSSAWSRCLITSTATCAAVASLFTFVPWLGPYRAPAVVEYSPLSIVRADCAGFVSELMVQPGDRVAAGDILAVLENPEQSLQLNELKLSIQRGELRSRILKRDDKLAEYQAERERVAALELQLGEKAKEVDSLILRAPIDGVVIGRRLTTLVGTYLAKGDEILAIGEEHGKELRVSVAQHDVQWFSARVGRPVRLWLGDGQLISGTLAKLEPQASAVPPHDALGANCGGPLPVLERRAGEGKKESVHLEFLTPRFTGIVPLDSGAASEVFSGQLGEVSFRAASESFGGHLVTLSGRWLKDKLDHLTRKL